LACQKPSAEVVALRVDGFKVSLKGLGGPTSKSLDICVRETVIGGLLGRASAEAMALVRSWVRDTGATDSLLDNWDEGVISKFAVCKVEERCVVWTWVQLEELAKGVYWARRGPSCSK
jgi:hypothetical protein